MTYEKRPGCELIEALPAGGDWQMRVLQIPGQKPTLVMINPEHPPRFIRDGMMHSEPIKL